MNIQEEKKDKKYKIDYKNCMKHQCEHCKYKQYCFKEGTQKQVGE